MGCKRILGRGCMGIISAQAICPFEGHSRPGWTSCRFGHFGYAPKAADSRFRTACRHVLIAAMCGAAEIAYSLGEGEMSPNGWCPIYTMFFPLDRGGHI
jgi:hypothetical protein